MENYFTFIHKCLSSLGINFDSVGKFEKPLRFWAGFAVLVSTFQSLMFVITSTEFNFAISSALTIGLFDIQGSAKLLTVFFSVKKLKEIKKMLKSLMDAITMEQAADNSKELNKYRKITKTILITNVSCIWIFNVLPMITLIYIFMANGVMVKAFPFAFWYPFNKTEVSEFLLIVFCYTFKFYLFAALFSGLLL